MTREIIFPRVIVLLAGDSKIVLSALQCWKMSKFESSLMPRSSSVISLVLSDGPMKAQGGEATSPLTENTFVGAANCPSTQAGSGGL
ncbi:hypothetical protein ACE6H2_026136 [Prunus campanulata]